MIKKLDTRFVVLCVILLFCVALVIGIISSNIHQQRKREERERYEQMIEAQTDTNSELKDVINSGDIDEYAAGIARDQLGYGESDEKVYVNITGK
jgi:cell division protein FtsB